MNCYFYSMEQNTHTNPSHTGKWFLVHFLITLLAWAGPFLFSWYLMAAAYALVMLQFLLLNRCIVNAKHALPEENEMTFYAYLFESAGIKIPRRPLKFIVRRILYPLFGVFAYIWQIPLGHAPILF